MDLSVVIPVLGNHDVLRRVLDGFATQDVDPQTFEVLVVADRHEPDLGAVDAALADRPYVVRRMQGAVAGASANRNVGWRAADAPLILFTDSDTIPAADLVRRHLAAHARQPAVEVAVVGHVRWAAGVTVTPFMRWLDRGVQFDFGAVRGDTGHWAMLYTANTSVKRALLDRVGGFDEERFPYNYEDLDWGRRARDHGLAVVYDRQAIVDHWRTMTVAMWQRRAPRLAAAEWRFCARYPDVRPWFRDLFADAATSRRPAVGAGLVRWVGPEVPWLGPRVWAQAGLRWRRAIAPMFLAGWERAAAGEGDVHPDVEGLLAERATPDGS